MTDIVTAFRHLCTRNFDLKLLSLALAVCIWSFTALSRETHYELVLPVELRNVPPGYALVASPQGTVRFTLSGPTIMIDGARRANASLILNLRGVGPGRTLFSHLETDLKLPDGVRVTRISPATLEIDLVRKQTTSPQGDNEQ
jgi:hypothetical protein